MKCKGKTVVCRNKKFNKRNKVGRLEPLINPTDKPMDHRLSKFIDNTPKVRVSKINLISSFELKQNRMFFLEQMILTSEHKGTVKKCKQELKELMNSN